LTRSLPSWREAPAAAPEVWTQRRRWVQTMSAGVDVFPRWLLEVSDLSCGKGIASVAIAEYVLASILAFEKRLHAVTVTGAAQWQVHSLGGLSGKTIGIVGYGTIGREVARRAVAFDMVVKAVRRSAWDGSDQFATPAENIEALIEMADHLVIAVPVTVETRQLIDARLLARARPGLHLINVSRGALVDQDALVSALHKGTLAGATLDVTNPEPLPDGHPLYSFANVRITPHVSWSDPSYDQKFTAKLMDNFDRYLSGRPLVDLVIAQRGY